ncbi:MAG: hypothetical protein RIB98_11305 [Acidimicrobiales bacterium]
MGDDTSTAQADWIVGATDSIIGYVDKARTVGTDNMVRVLRAVVFGLVAMVFGIAAVIFTVVLAVRMADAYLPIGAGVGDATWAAHLFIGTLLSILGFGLWASRKSTSMRNFWLAVAVDFVIIVVLVAYGLAS